MGKYRERCFQVPTIDHSNIATEIHKTAVIGHMLVVDVLLLKYLWRNIKNVIDIL